MKVAIVHNSVSEAEDDPSLRDVLDQAEFVRRTLAEAGYVCRCFALESDLRESVRRLRTFKPDRIFNLVESVSGRASLHPCAAALWELLGIPHTGSSSLALALTTDKAMAKSLLTARGLPTPEWNLCRAGETVLRDEVPAPWIVKPSREDASIGIDEDSVVRTPEALAPRVQALQQRFPHQAVLIEHFVEGREFNISLLGAPTGPLVLPPAEMLFCDYPPGKERVVGFRAKWDQGAFEYSHTRRRFDFPTADADLLERLRELATACWHVFRLRGYARVDFRVDAAGNPFILEVNANPCLAPDGGFVAAVAQAGISPQRMLEMILEDVVGTV